MHDLVKKDQIFTVPNLLSIVRLTLIPVIVWVYICLQDYPLAVFLIAFSAATDVADGIIARKFHMVSDFGKILDPVADHATQIALLLCLMSRYARMKLLVIAFIVREICMAFMGYLAIRQSSFNSAKWYGKANTVILYLVMVILILFPGISQAAANALITACIVSVILSLCLYIRFYVRLLYQHKHV